MVAVQQLIVNLRKQIYQSHTVNGLRVTSEEMIDIVQSTLIGKVNPALVHELNAAGITAVGLNGFDGTLLESELFRQRNIWLCRRSNER